VLRSSKKVEQRADYGGSKWEKVKKVPGKKSFVKKRRVGLRTYGWPGQWFISWNLWGTNREAAKGGER